MKCIFFNIIKRLYQNIFCNIHWKNLVKLSKEVTSVIREYGTGKIIYSVLEVRFKNELVRVLVHLTKKRTFRSLLVL